MKKNNTEKTILLVEDEFIIASAEKCVIESFGYNVVIAESGEKAISFASLNDKPDLILMDIDLGDGICGTEAAVLILEKNNIPIVFLTSHLEEEMVQKVHGITRFGYVIKESGNFVLKTSIEMAFELFEAHEQSRKKEKTLFERNQQILQAQEVAGIGTYTFDLNRKQLLWSDNCFSIFGIEFSEVPPCFSQQEKYFHPDDLVDFKSDIKSALNENISYISERRIMRSDGETVYVTDSGKIVHDEKNNIHHLVGLIQNISGRKNVEIELSENEKMFVHVFEKINDPVAIIRIEDNMCLYVNNGFTGLTGISKSDVLGKTYSNFNLWVDLSKREYMISELQKHGFIDSLEAEFYRIDKSKFTALISAKLIVYKGKQCIITISRDISKRKTFEEKLKKQNEEYAALMTEYSTLIKELENVQHTITDSELKYRTLYQMMRLMCDNVSDMIWAKDLNNCYVFANKSICSGLLNAADTEEPIGKNDIFFAERERKLHSDNPEWHTFGEICRDTDKMTVEAGIPQQFDEYGNIKGEFLYLDVRKSPFIDESGNLIGTVGSARDVTEAKKNEKALKESEEKFKTLVQNSHEIIYTISDDGTMLYVSPRWTDILGHPVEDVIGSNFRKYVHPDDIPACEKVLIETINNDNSLYNIEYRVFHLNGSIRWHRSALIHVGSEDQKQFSIVGNALDVTENKIAEQKVNDFIREKEILLKEVHHRIKNNMNIMMSLLTLQSKTLSDPAAVQALNDARSRMQSMNVLYDKLYRSEGFREMKAVEYISPLIDEIVSNFPASNSVKIVKDITDFSLPVKTLSYVGIMINEIITNAMKYAFADRDDNIISVAVRKDDNVIVIDVHDNGTGIDEKISDGDSSGFGLKLIEMLAAQMQGSVSIKRDNGTRAVLKFKE